MIEKSDVIKCLPNNELKLDLVVLFYFIFV